MKNSKIWYNLYQELIIEIFTWLPVKSLLRFRSISKWLCACIGSPDFIRLHALRSPKKVMIVHRQLNHEGVNNPNHIYTLHSECQLSSSPYTSVTAVDYPFAAFSILGSSNGIMCLFKREYGISLWNPSTRRKLTVQDRPSWRDTWSRSEGHLYGAFGFGYDPILDDYKILRINKPEVYSMYTLKTDAWCEIRGPATPYSYISTYQCLFNGSLHWVAKHYCELPELGGECRYHIMTFDLSTDVFSALALPEPSWDTRQVTIIKGYLAVISLENDYTWIWVRKEEYSTNASSWSVAFKLNATETKHSHKVFQLTADGDLLWRSSFHEEIIVYNPATRVQSKLEKFRDSPYVNAFEMYVEGLGLLHMGTLCSRADQY